MLKKIALSLITNVLLIGNDNSLFIKYLDNFDLDGIKILVENKKIEINRPDSNCKTILDFTLDKFQDTGLENIDKILTILSYLEENGAKRYITYKEIKECNLILKEKIRLTDIKSQEKMSDGDLVSQQLSSYRVNSSTFENEKIAYFVNTLNIYVNMFNNSLFGQDGNYIVLKNFNSKLYSNIEIDIADWKETSTHKLIKYSKEKLTALESINIEKFEEELEELFKNRRYLNQIQFRINKLSKKLSMSLNEEERKEIQQGIDRSYSSFQYIISDSIANLIKFRSIFK
jgi:hypothetical protein